MKKQIVLQALLLRVGVVSLLVCFVAISIWAIVSGMESSSEDALMRAKNNLSFKQTEVNSLSNQIENSKGAEVFYAKYILTRTTDRFDGNVDAAKVLLNKLRQDFQLSPDLKLTLSVEAPLTEVEFANLPHSIAVRENTSLSFGGLTDVHAFAFIQALQAGIPGIIEITGLKVSKKDGGLNGAALAQISAGASPVLAEATLNFNWYGLQPKKEKTQ